MATNIPREPQKIKEALDEYDLPSTIYQGFETGCSEVQEYFHGKMLDINKPLAAMMARFHALDYLTRSLKQNPFYIETVPGNGISLRSEWCRIKALKVFDGEIPSANSSERSHQFYAQDLPNQRDGQTRLFDIDWETYTPWHQDDWETFVSKAHFVNLVLCWSADSAYNLTRLQLLSPCQTGKNRKGVKLFWDPIDIPHPITNIVPASTINDADVEDLPIYFEDDQEMFGND